VPPPAPELDWRGATPVGPCGVPASRGQRPPAELVVAVSKDAFDGALEHFPLLIELFLGTIRGPEGSITRSWCPRRRRSLGRRTHRPQESHSRVTKTDVLLIMVPKGALGD